MLQIIEGREVYVVEFDTMPTLPITWETEEEKPYAVGLAAAIHSGQITEPGKYGIEATRDGDQWVYNAYRIEE
jgi:hypothetical protein